MRSRLVVLGVMFAVAVVRAAAEDTAYPSGSEKPVEKPAEQPKEPAKAQPAPPPAAKPAEKPAFYFIVDYLPSVIAEGDTLVGCFRIENTTAVEAKCEVVVTAYGPSGDVLAERTEAVTAPARGFGSAKDAQPARGCSKLRFVARKGQEQIGAVIVCLLRNEDVWPETRIRGGRLENVPDGHVLVPVVAPRKKVEDRAFAPVRWLLAAGASALEDTQALVCVPARWQLGGQPFGKATTVKPLGPYDKVGAPPILCAASAILNELRASAQAGGKQWSKVVICLPPEDLEVAADPAAYRLMLESLLAHIGPPVKRVVLLAPLQYGAGESHCEALWNQVEGAAGSYGASCLDAAGCLDEALWRSDPQRPGVYGSRPNAAGLKKIEDELKNLVQ